jgi:hypothetical protein
MNTGARLGLAVTVGYFLGRFHKMKWALAAAALAGRGQLPSGPGGLVQQGAKLLTSSPEFTKLTDEMKGRLVEAGKAAAVAAVSSKIDSLSEGLRGRSEAMRATRAGGTGGAAADDEKDVEEDVEDERYRDQDERYRDEDRAAEPRRKRHRDEDDDSRDQAERVPAPRGESDRPRGDWESRSRKERAAHGRAGHPSRHGGEGDGGRSGVGAGHGQDDGRHRPRSSASRDGGDSE